VELYVPPLQGWHDPELLDDEKNPKSQGVQESALDVEKDPTPHS